MQLSFKINLIICGWLFAFLFVSCSNDDTKYINSGIPEHPLNMDETHNPQQVQILEKKWFQFANAFGMDPGYAWLNVEELNQDLQPGDREKLSEAKLTKQLSTPPSLLTDEARRPEYLRRLTLAGDHFANRAHRTRCAEVVSVKHLHSARTKTTHYEEPHKRRISYTPEAKEFSVLRRTDGQAVARVYQLNYRLQLAQKQNVKQVGDRPKTIHPEGIVRSGLVVVPENAKNTAPLLAYGHLGDHGLSYREIAGLFGDMQQDHIIIAPSFPGEPICHGWGQKSSDGSLSCDKDGLIAPPIGKVSTWDYDADELLGMHHCVYQLIADETDSLLPKTDKLTPLKNFQDQLRKAFLPQEIGSEVKGLVASVQDWVGKVIKETLEGVFELNQNEQNDFVSLIKEIQQNQDRILKDPLTAYDFISKNQKADRFREKLNPMFSHFMNLNTSSTSDGTKKQGGTIDLDTWWQMTKMVISAFPTEDGAATIGERFSKLNPKVFEAIISDEKLLNNLLMYMGSSLTGETLLKLKELQTNFKGKPASIIMGSSRGGMVAGVALAKVGAALGRTGENLNQVGNDTPGEQQLVQLQKVLAEPLGEAYQGMPSQFSCAAFVSSPMSVMTGRFRILLRMLVTGEIEKTAFMRLPGISNVKDLFQEYREDTTNDPTILENAVNLSFRRDVPFLGPYIITALNNWSMFDWIKLLDTKGKSRFPKGALIYLHGLDDLVVPVEQSQIAYNVLYQQAHSPEVLRKTLSLGMKPHSDTKIDMEETHGLNMTFRAFQLRDEDRPRIQLKSPFYTQHLDDLFLRSTSVIPDGYFKPQDAPLQAMIEEAMKSARESLEKAEAIYLKAQKTYGAYNKSSENNHPEVMSARAVFLDAFELHNVIIKELWEKTSFDERKVTFYARQLFDKADEAETTNTEERLARSVVIAGALKSVNLRIQELTNAKGNPVTYLEDEGSLTPHDVLKKWRYTSCAKALKP